MVEGSTCGLAGRFFLRMSFLIFFSVGAATSSLVATIAADASFDSVSTGAMMGGVAVSTSVIFLPAARLNFRSEKMNGKAEIHAPPFRGTPATLLKRSFITRKCIFLYVYPSTALPVILPLLILLMFDILIYVRLLCHLIRYHLLLLHLLPMSLVNHLEISQIDLWQDVKHSFSAEFGLDMRGSLDIVYLQLLHSLLLGNLGALW